MSNDIFKTTFETLLPKAEKKNANVRPNQTEPRTTGVTSKGSTAPLITCEICWGPHYPAFPVSLLPLLSLTYTPRLVLGLGSSSYMRGLRVKVYVKLCSSPTGIATTQLGMVWKGARGYGGVGVTPLVVRLLPQQRNKEGIWRVSGINVTPDDVLINIHQ